MLAGRGPLTAGSMQRLLGTRNYAQKGDSGTGRDGDAAKGI